jgi:hypothetical protein
MILVFGIEWVCRRIALYLRHRNKASLTRATPHRNTPDQCATNLLKHLLIFWCVDLSPGSSSDHAAMSFSGL